MAFTLRKDLSIRKGDCPRVKRLKKLLRSIEKLKTQDPCDLQGNQLRKLGREAVLSEELVALESFCVNRKTSFPESVCISELSAGLTSLAAADVFQESICPFLILPPSEESQRHANLILDLALLKRTQHTWMSQGYDQV